MPCRGAAPSSSPIAWTGALRPEAAKLSGGRLSDARSATFNDGISTSVNRASPAVHMKHSLLPRGLYPLGTTLLPMLRCTVGGRSGSVRGDHDMSLSTEGIGLGSLDRMALEFSPYGPA